MVLGWPAQSLETVKYSGLEFPSEAKVGDILSQANAIVYRYAQNETLKTVLGTVADLMAEVQFVEFVGDALALDINETLTAAQTIVETLVGEVQIITDIFNVAQAGLSGTLRAIKVDGEAMWAAVPEAYKPYIIAAGVVTGVVLYFVANDVLVDIVGSALGENEVLGTFIAQPLGFTNAYAEGSEANELANAVFTTKVVDIINSAKNADIV